MIFFFISVGAQEKGICLQAGLLYFFCLYPLSVVGHVLVLNVCCIFLWLTFVVGCRVFQLVVRC
jgi:hypothetical protein